MPGRPTGREKHVTSGGQGVYRREKYESGGPVGREQGAGKQSSQGTGGTYRAGSSGGSYGGGRGSGGGGLLRLIIIGAIILLGGGGGLSALLGGGGSSESSTATSTSGTSSSGYSSTSSNTGFGHGSGSFSGSSGSSASSGSYGYGSSYGSDLISQLLGGGYGSGTYGTGSGSWSSSSSGTGSTGGYGTSSYGTTGSSPYGSYSGSDTYDSYDTGTISGSDTGFDLSSLSDLFSAGVSTSAAGITAGWNDGRDNRGVLNTKVADGSRKKYTRLVGNGRDTVTLMVYMCGTDLESKGGMGTSDLTEMVNADLSDDVNVLVYTGGCSSWKNSVVSSRTNQIYRIRKGGLERLVDDDGDRAMTDPATLTRFVRWSASNYPASRYQLIFWDHGSGSLSGYGYDQKHSRSGSMGLSEIKKAVESSGIKFDFIGFDACLMATVENALALAESADYLIASEETEPGTGWYYTNWLTDLSRNTSVPTTTLGQRIIDDFVDVSARKARGQDTTLSLVDLAELQTTFPKAFSAFSKDTGSMIKSEYKTVSTARKSSREFATSNRIDQIDLTDLAWKIGTDEGKQLAAVLLGAIKYNRTSTSMCNSYGLSIYFPGSRLSKVDSMVNTYRELGIDSDYTRCIQQYATVSGSGQAATGGTSSLYDMLSGYGYGSGSGSSYSGSSSYGSASPSAYGTQSLSGMGSDLLMDLVGSFLTGRSMPIADLDRSNSAFLKESQLTSDEVVRILGGAALDSEKLKWDTSSGLHVLHLEPEEWDQVSQLTVNMLFDDGEGFLDLGEDNTYVFNEAGDLQGETDRTWLSINSHPVAFFHIGTVKENGSSVTIGRVPCLLNGDRVNLIIAFDEANPYGYIAGARYDYVNGETQTLAKAMTELQTGDRLDFLCDYYTYDGKYDSTWIIGQPVYVEDVMVISNTDVGEGGALVTYKFTDLYGQIYWMEPIRQ